MAGNGRAIDSIFIERFRGALKRGKVQFTSRSLSELRNQIPILDLVW